MPDLTDIAELVAEADRLIDLAEDAVLAAIDAVTDAGRMFERIVPRDGADDWEPLWVRVGADRLAERLDALRELIEGHDPARAMTG